MKSIHYKHDGNEWTWWISGEDKCYYTNRMGQGIFVQDITTGQTRQLVGTCQFSVSGLKDPRAKIRRWMNVGA